MFLQRSQPVWKSGKTLNMSFQFSSQGKTQGICFSQNAGNPVLVTVIVDVATRHLKKGMSCRQDQTIHVEA